MKRRWFPIWIFPVLILMAIGTIWLRLFIVGTSYTINQVDNRIKNLQQDREQLELKVASLRSPRRLEVLARAKFGLAPPKSEQMVHLK